MCCSPPVCASFHLHCSACVQLYTTVWMRRSSCRPAPSPGVFWGTARSDLKHLKLLRRLLRFGFVFPSGVFWGLYIQEIYSVLQGRQIWLFFFNGQKYVYLFGEPEVAHNAILVLCFSSVSWNLENLQIASSTNRIRPEFSRVVQGDRAAS